MENLTIVELQLLKVHLLNNIGVAKRNVAELGKELAGLMDNLFFSQDEADRIQKYINLQLDYIKTERQTITKLEARMGELREQKLARKMKRQTKKKPS